MIAANETRPGRPTSIAIVGGGPGGLLTAFFLQRGITRPVRITILEASGRLGGKILTPSFTAAPVRYEAGAAEFYDYSPVGADPLRELVAALGLATTPLAGTSVMMDGATVSNLDDVAEHLGPAARRAVAAFDLAARSRMTPREFYASDESPPAAGGAFTGLLDGMRSRAARRYVETLIHSDLATEPVRTSVAYGLQNYLMNDPAYMRLYAIAGGNEQLVAALVSRIDADVRLRRPVTQIEAGEAGMLRVTAACDGRPRAEEFDAVVVALPMQHLASITFAGRRLAAAVHTHREAHDHPAHYLRITALFAEPFWRGRIDGSFAMLDAFAGCCLYDESSREPGSRHGVLGWLLGGDAAVEMARLTDDELVARAIASLPAALMASPPRMLEARVHRWTGAVSGLPGGWRSVPVDRRHQPEPVAHPHLFFVGDYLFDSTLNGVLDSAHHVAGWLGSLVAD